MKIRVLDRILVAIAGVVILAICAGIVAQVFFQVNVIDFISTHMNVKSDLFRILAAVAAGILLLIGLYCILMLFRHRSKRDKFILQKMESGELAISLKAMETMVSKCMEQHKEIDTQSIRLENQRDGLIIKIRGTVAGGISIPLTIDTLQKQIKQYVTACSGVEVKGIRVQIESSGEDAQDAPFAIDPPTSIPLLRGSEKKEDVPEESIHAEPAGDASAPGDEPTVQEEIPSPAMKSAAEAAMEAAETLMKEYEEENVDDRPIHQRLFSTPEEPCIMPLPPEDLNETASACAAEEIEAEIPADINPDQVPEEGSAALTAEEPASENESPEEKTEAKE